MSVRLCTELFYCGVGTVVAVEALVATLFSPILIFIAFIFISEQSPLCNITKGHNNVNSKVLAADKNYNSRIGSSSWFQ